MLNATAASRCFVFFVRFKSFCSPSSTRQQRLGRDKFLGHILDQFLLQKTLGLHRSGLGLDGNPAPVCEMCSVGKASAVTTIAIAVSVSAASTSTSARVLCIVARRVGVVVAPKGEPIRRW